MVVTAKHRYNLEFRVYKLWRCLPQIFSKRLVQLFGASYLNLTAKLSRGKGSKLKGLILNMTADQETHPAVNFKWQWALGSETISCYPFIFPGHSSLFSWSGQATAKKENWTCQTGLVWMGPFWGGSGATLNWTTFLGVVPIPIPLHLIFLYT